MPEITPKSVTFTPGDVGSTADLITSIPKQVPVIAAEDPVFPSIGVYTYTILEQKALTGGTSIDPDKEKITFSYAQYELTFVVKEKANKSGLYVAAIAAKIINKDNSSQNPGDKVDPTPGTGGSYSALVFTNAYTKTTGGIDPTIPANQVLVISPTVTGEFADPTRYFTYELYVIKHALYPGTGIIYKAYILDDSDGIVDPINNQYTSYTYTIKTDGNGRKYLEIPEKSTRAVNLKQGQRLVFTDLHVGTSYSALQKGTYDYTPRVDIIADGALITPPLTAPISSALSTGTIIIGAAKNSAAFTNDYKSIPITGLVINNLPFIMILVLAAGAFILFLILKYRKRRDYASDYKTLVNPLIK